MEKHHASPVVPVAAELMVIAQMMRSCADAAEALPCVDIADSLTILSSATRLMELELSLYRGLITPEAARAETMALMRAAEPQNQQSAGGVQ